MKRRWIAAAATLTVVLLGLTIGAALRYHIPMVGAYDVSFGADHTQEEIEAYFAWVNSGYMYYNVAPWLLAAALVTGVLALALVVRRAQLRAQAGSASATASRDTSRSSSTSSGSAESSSTS